jgi:CBS domain-containing protein
VTAASSSPAAVPENGWQPSVRHDVTTVMQVHDIMTRGPETVTPDDSIQQAAMAMDQLNVGILPVCSGRRLVGVITDRDIAVRAASAGDSPVDQVVGDFMTRNAAYAYEDEPAEDALMRMQTLQVRRLMVLDREKNLVGVLSLGDIATEPDAVVKDDLAEALSEVSEPSRPRK